MNQWNFPTNRQTSDFEIERYDDTQFGRPQQPLPTADSAATLFDNLRGLCQWDEIASQISQESQGRIAFVGLTGAGKSQLFNRLRGWQVSPDPTAEAEPWQLSIEAYGSFLLADLPAAPQQTAPTDLWLALGEPELVLYLLDAAQGVTPDDYRWVSLLRASGRPFLLALNKCDKVTDLAAVQHQVQQRLALTPIPISAHTGNNIEETLLPALLNAAPKLALTLGRELTSLRRHAARRVIRQTAVFAGMVGAQPIPVLDIPFQAMLQAGVVLRVGAAYGFPPNGGINREIVGTILSVFGIHYFTQSLVKLVPILGWVISGLISSSTTLLIGEAAIHYYEANATIPLPQVLRQLAQTPLWRRRIEPSVEEEQEISVQ